MKRALVAAMVGIGATLACGGALPLVIPRVSAQLGVTVGGAGWCAGGLCLVDVEANGVTVATAHLGWDRSARLAGVRVPVATARSGADPGGGGTGGGSFGRVSSVLTVVEVEDLVVADTPLPPLSGRVHPERRLSGEGVTIDGDTVHATLPTDFGAVAVEARPAEGGIALVARCEACRVPPPSDADPPLPLPPVVARGTWKEGAFAGTVRIEDVEVAVEARPDGEGAVADLRLKPTPIASIYGVLAPVVPEVARARIEGTVRGEAHVRWPGGIETVEPVIDGFAVAGVVPEGLDGGGFVFRALDPSGEPTVVRAGEGTPDWTPLVAMGEWLPAAVIAAEDAGFREHPGYDLAGMQAAAAANAEAGEIKRGGSTLTQQLAKNLFLDGTRSYVRKARELLYAVELEQELGKRRILELYLNVVEFGPGLRGARAAARTYFLKEPAGLLPEEAAWLASILRYPRTAYRTQYLADAPDTSRVQWILQNLRDVPEEARIAAMGRKVRLVPP